MHKVPDKYWVSFIYLALTITTLAVFWQVRNFQFTNYDDDDYVSGNNHISSGLTRENIVWVFTHEHGGNWHPLTGLSHILDCQLFDLNAGRHHIVNLLFHIANTLLLFTVLRRMTGLPRRSEAKTVAIWQSAFVAALFALHPLHVESVAWISERKDVLSMLFWLLTMAAYFHYVKTRKISIYIVTLVLFAMGLMAKPMVVTLPFVLLLLDYWPLERFNGNNLRHLIFEKITFFILAAVSSIVTFFVQQSAGAIRKLDAIPLMSRIANALISYLSYIGKLFAPVHLSAFYPHRGQLPAWQIIGAIILLLAITICVIRLADRYRYLPVGWFWYLGTLVPVIGLVQAGEQAMADRYTYIPLTGLFIVIAWGTNDLLAQWRYRKIFLSLSAIAVILILPVLAWFQTASWQNNTSLFEHALKLDNRNYMAHNIFGVALLSEGKLDEAVTHFHSAIDADPDYAEAINNLGIAYGRMGRVHDEIETYKKAIKIRPNFALLHYNLALAYSKLDRYQDVIEACMRTIEIKPDYADAYNILGAAYSKMAHFKEAADSYRQAIKAKSDFAEAYNNLGVACMQLGRLPDAIENFKQAVKIKPDYAEAYNNIGAVYNQLGRRLDALEVYKQAIGLKPDYVNAHYNLGLTLLTIGDSNSALAEYEILKKLNTEKAKALFDTIHK